MFTSVATLQLVEAGKLALDDPIGKHLPDYPNKDVASKVTVRHLLTHTGGTGDIFGPEFDQNRLKLRGHSDYVKLYGSREPLFDPGARYEYSNYGFVLLGALIEAVSGESYYDYVREHVFRPAGMTATDSLPESEDVPNRAAGYTRPFPGVELGCRTPTRFRGGARPRAAATRRSATSCDSQRRSSRGSSSRRIHARRGDQPAERSSTGTASTCREKGRCEATATAAERPA